MKDDAALVADVRTGSFHDAEDVAQDVFVETFQRLGALNDAGRLGPWLRSITIRRCIDGLRRRYRENAVDDAATDLPATRDPVNGADRQELRERVLNGVAPDPYPACHCWKTRSIG